MNRIYFYLYSFLRSAPRKDDASGWAAVFAPLFIVINAMAVWFSAEILLDTDLSLRHGKVIVGAVIAASSGYSYWHYELTGGGKPIVAAFSTDGHSRRNAVLGGIIFIETVFGGLIPGLIAVIKNPTP